jgi:hypothetical protein
MTVPVSAVQADGMVPSRTKEAKMKVTRNIVAIVVFSATVLVGTATAKPTPLGLKAEARIYHQHQQQQLQQQGPTALGLKAWGERLQGEARVYQQQPPRTVASSAGHFDWSDAGIGALLGFALAIGCVGALLLGRRFRRTQFATF